MFLPPHSQRQSCYDTPAHPPPVLQAFCPHPHTPPHPWQHTQQQQQPAPVVVVGQHVAVSVAPGRRPAARHTHAVPDGRVQCCDMLVLPQQLGGLRGALLERPVCAAVPVLQLRRRQGGACKQDDTGQARERGGVTGCVRCADGRGSVGVGRGSHAGDMSDRQCRQAEGRE